MSCEHRSGRSICTGEDAAPRHIPNSAAQGTLTTSTVQEIRAIVEQSGDTIEVTKLRKHARAQSASQCGLSNHAMIILSTCKVNNQRYQRSPFCYYSWKGRDPKECIGTCRANTGWLVVLHWTKAV